MGPVINSAAGSAAGLVVDPAEFLVKRNFPAVILVVKIGSAADPVVVEGYNAAANSVVVSTVIPIVKIISTADLVVD